MIWKVLWYWPHPCQQWGLRHSHGRMHRVNDYQEVSSPHSARVLDLQWYNDPLSHRKNILLLPQFTGTSLLLWASCLGSGCFIVLSVYSEIVLSLLGLTKPWQSSALLNLKPPMFELGVSHSVYYCCAKCESEFLSILLIYYWCSTGFWVSSSGQCFPWLTLWLMELQLIHNLSYTYWSTYWSFCSTKHPKGCYLYVLMTKEQPEVKTSLASSANMNHLESHLVFCLQLLFLHFQYFCH